MINISPKYLIWFGFSITLLLMTAVIILSTNQLEKTNQQMDQIVSISNVKSDLINQMYTHARERSLSLLRMLTQEDPFELDDERMNMDSLASAFMRTRARLLKLSMSDHEKSLLDEQKKLTGIAAPIQLRVMNLIIDDEKDKAREILINEALPRQNAVLKQLQKIIEHQKVIIHQQLDIAKFEYKKTITIITIITVFTFFAIIAALIMINWVVKKVIQGESALFSETAFQSIAEGIITLNEAGNIQYLNTVSQDIIGKNQVDCIGVPITSVLHLEHEETHEKIDNPLALLFSNKSKVTFNHHTLTNLTSNNSIAVDISASPIIKDNDLIGAVITLRDVQKERELKQQLKMQASTDALTGLINRFEFERSLNLFLNQRQKRSVEGTLIYLDLDQFKVINDTCGHLAGDVLLQELAYLIQSVLRASDKLARLGGDEFAIILNACPLDKGEKIALKILSIIQDYRFQHEAKVFSVGASIGVVHINNDIHDLNDLMKKADAACYAAKDAGRNRIHIYHMEDYELSQKQGQMRWVTRISESLESNQFVLYYQTIESLHPTIKQQPSCEILIRMKAKNGEIILPGAFITAAERYNLIIQLDRWVIENLFKTLAEQPGLLTKFAHFSINLSGISLADEALLVFISEQLDHYQIPARKICFEITETAAIGRLSVASHFIHQLKKKGCCFALDDFGCGLSSFAYLKELPVEIIKIDGIFIKDILIDPIDEAMVRSINEIGHIMGKKTVAEFVESIEIKERLQEIGIDFAQGYALSRPEPLSYLYD